MRIEPSTTEPLTGFEPGDHVAVTWEDAEGRLHTKNGTLVARTRHGVTIKSPSDTVPLTYTADVLKSIGRAK